VLGNALKASVVLPQAGVFVSGVAPWVGMIAGMFIAAAMVAWALGMIRWGGAAATRLGAAGGPPKPGNPGGGQREKKKKPAKGGPGSGSAAAAANPAVAADTGVQHGPALPGGATQVIPNANPGVRYLGDGAGGAAVERGSVPGGAGHGAKWSVRSGSLND